MGDLMASSVDIANTMLGGKLEELLRGWRDDGDSLRTIAKRLQNMNINTNREQVRRWCHFYEIDTSRARETA